MASEGLQRELCLRFKGERLPCWKCGNDGIMGEYLALDYTVPKITAKRDLLVVVKAHHEDMVICAKENDR